MNTSSAPMPTHIVLHKKSRILTLIYADDHSYELPFEYLRVYSPSAEVRGHGKDQAILQYGKRHVDIVTLEAVGHYGLQPIFLDGHRSGIYSWHYLHQLATEHHPRWQQYLQKLTAPGKSRG